MRAVDAVYARIKELLSEKKMTMYMLAKRSGVPFSTISTMTRSKTVTLATIYGICEGFGMTLKEFFDSPLFARAAITD